MKKLINGIALITAGIKIGSCPMMEYDRAFAALAIVLGLRILIDLAIKNLSKQAA